MRIDHCEYYGWLIVTVIFIISSSSTGSSADNCSEFGKRIVTDKEYLNKILVALSKEENYTTPDSHKFLLTVCKKAVSPSVSNDKAGLIDVTNKVVIARYDDIYGEVITAPKDATPVVYFRFNGDSCKNNVNRYATVIVICELGLKKPQFRYVSANDSCVYTFVLTTSVLCDVERPAPAPVPAPAPAPVPAPAAVTPSPTQNSTNDEHSSSGMNPFSGFLLFIFALALGYCFFGFLYKRYVLGARGAQQIPNYLFWVRISHSIRDCLSNRPSNQYSSSTSRTTNYDMANSSDVQLINNEDEFKYDQPPLTVGYREGQSSSFREQQLNVASSPATPSTNAQRQEQPLLVNQDEADEQLLPV